ncbi:BCCT family transporter [uncultured Agrococcus sp.]|uniref:BCCT family transporter n=1 Tax=uncultured Agrococcus sp. TaxID=382258 RepID=UPI0025E7E20E|nr:BCCT family transporter [uncultured Agrococcus sp.]
MHPALIPGIGVDNTGYRFRTNWWIFAFCLVFIIGFLAWGFSAPEHFASTGSGMRGWITQNLGWLLSTVAVIVFLFMAWVAFSKRGRIRLGQDGEKPEFSTVSWIAMLFGAGMGATLIFYGAYEPLEYFMNVPPGFDAEPNTTDAALSSMAQITFHWGAIPWAIYGLIGGAMAYSTYRRGRPGLISAIFDPIFNQRTKGILGPVVDIFSIIVTIFGTATSLGVGALQIMRGVQLVSGLPPMGNALLIGIVAVLTAIFLTSAVSGVKRGIRFLSNLNMLIAGSLALFVLIAGPTFFLLNFMPSSVMAFFQELPTMLMRSSIQGEAHAEFMQTWTVFYWAWWIAIIPYVGMFIAKISRGRTLREFFIGVVGGPTIVSFLWFAIMGGTSMYQQSQGHDLYGSEEVQDILFNMLDTLPLGTITSVVAMISIVIFFVTSADSSTLVMGSIAQGGRTAPTKWVTITFGLAVSLFSLVMLLAGGETLLSTVEAFVTIAGLPFSILVLFLMYAWAKDLNNDPVLWRQKYAQVAIEEGVKRGIEEHGDDFTFASEEVADPDQGAGAWFDSEDPAHVEWYEEATTGSIGTIDPHRADLDESERENVVQRLAAEKDTYQDRPDGNYQK